MSSHVTHHEALLNAVLVIDDFGDGRQAIGGAGGIAVTTEMEMLSAMKSKPQPTVLHSQKVKTSFVMSGFTVEPRGSVESAGQHTLYR